MAKQKNNTDYLKQIRGIIKEEYIPDNQKLLVENNKDHKGADFDMQREICAHAGLEYLLVRFDMGATNQPLFPFFTKDKGLNQMCDYILFAQKSNTLFIVLIELKCGTEPALEQLAAGEVFADFLIKSGKRVGLEIAENIEYRKLKVKGQTGQKTKTAQTGLKTDEHGQITCLSQRVRINAVLDAE